MEIRLVADARVERHSDRAGNDRHRDLSPEQVYELIARLDGEEDVTVVIRRDGEDGELLVAISGHVAFVGLTAPDGVFQYVDNDDSGATAVLQIGGQETRIDGRYRLAFPKAADVAAAWVRDGRQAACGAWEQR